MKPVTFVSDYAFSINVSVKSKVDRVGVDAISEVVAKHDGIAAQRLILELLK